MNYKIFVDMEEHWYRKDDVLMGCKEFLVQDPCKNSYFAIKTLQLYVNYVIIKIDIGKVLCHLTLTH